MRVHKYFAELGILATDQDIINLLRRVDKDNDNIIGKEDFILLVQPLEIIR